eukprot:scaffold262241_cov19-Tisochrysis_lutea.AAC.3
MQVTREVWSGATNNKKMTILIVPKTLWCSRSWLGFLWVETLLVHHCQSPDMRLHDLVPSQSLEFCGGTPDWYMRLVMKAA